MSIPSADQSEILVLGVGNVLMQDEGIGVYLVRELHHRYKFTPAIEIVDGGTTGLGLLDHFENRTKVLIVDAVNVGRPPGSIVQLANGEVKSQFEEKMSLHHLGLSDVLGVIELLGMKPPEIQLIGIQPHSMDVNFGLTSKLQVRIDEYLDQILAQLNRWNITASTVAAVAN